MMGFSSASLFHARKREAVTQDGRNGEETDRAKKRVEMIEYRWKKTWFYSSINVGILLGDCNAVNRQCCMVLAGEK